MARSITQRYNSNLSNLMFPQIYAPICCCTEYLYKVGLISHAKFRLRLPVPSSVRRWLKGLEDVDANIRQTHAHLHTHMRPLKRRMRNVSHYEAALLHLRRHRHATHAQTHLRHLHPNTATSEQLRVCNALTANSHQHWLFPRGGAAAASVHRETSAYTGARAHRTSVSSSFFWHTPSYQAAKGYVPPCLTPSKQCLPARSRTIPQQRHGHNVSGLQRVVNCS